MAARKDPSIRAAALRAAARGATSADPLERAEQEDLEQIGFILQAEAQHILVHFFTKK